MRESFLRNKSLVQTIFAFRERYTQQERTFDTVHEEFGDFSIHDISSVSSSSFGVDYGKHMYRTFNIYLHMMYGHLPQDEQDEIHDRLIDEMKCADFLCCSAEFLGWCEGYTNDNNDYKALINQLVNNQKYRYSTILKQKLSKIIGDVLVSKTS